MLRLWCEAAILQTLLVNPATQSTVVPFVVALIVTGLVRLIGGEQRGRQFVMVAVGIGFLVAFVLVEGAPAIAATTAKQKVFFIVVVGLVAGLLLDARASRRVLAERLAIVLFPLLVLLWMAQRLLSFGIELDVVLPLVVLWLGSMIVFWRLSVTGETGGALVPGVQLLVASVGLSVVALLGASASLAQLTAGLAASVGAVLLVAFLTLVFAGNRFGFGAVGAFGGGGALLAICYVLVMFTEGVSFWALAVLALVFLTDLVPVKARFGGTVVRRAMQPVMLTVIAAIPAGLAVLIAFLTGDGASPY